MHDWKLMDQMRREQGGICTLFVLQTNKV